MQGNEGFNFASDYLSAKGKSCLIYTTVVKDSSSGRNKITGNYNRISYYQRWLVPSDNDTIRPLALCDSAEEVRLNRDQV